MAPGTGSKRPGRTPPNAFVEAVESARRFQPRAEVSLEEVTPPKRLAPFAFALGATLTADDTELATGRLVLLYDPEGQDAWAGNFRLVAYVRTAVDQEMAADPMLPGVAWAWLIEALEHLEAHHAAAAGTVTRVSWEGFGGMAGNPAEDHIEIRASWTPASPEIAPHVAAWIHVMCTSAGLPPLPAGVVAMPSQRSSPESPGRRRR